jgi:hypothetical protein
MGGTLGSTPSQNPQINSGRWKLVMNLDSFFAMIVDVRINNKVKMVFAGLLISESV